MVSEEETEERACAACQGRHRAHTCERALGLASAASDATPAAADASDEPLMTEAEASDALPVSEAKTCPRDSRCPKPAGHFGRCKLKGGEEEVEEEDGLEEEEAAKMEESADLPTEVRSPSLTVGPVRCVPSLHTSRC